MEINVSDRRNRQGTRTAYNSNDINKTFTLKTLVIIAASMFIAKVLSVCFSDSLSSGGIVFIDFVCYAAAPVACFIAARVFEQIKMKQQLIAMSALMVIVAHIPYAYYLHNEFKLLSMTSFMLPLFTGLAALYVKDMPNIDFNTGRIVIFLLCLLGMLGSGGSVCSVWIFIFGCGAEKAVQKRFFMAAGFAMLFLSFIFGMINGHWYDEIYRAGFLLAIPILNRFNEQKQRRLADPGIHYVFLYPALTAVAALLRAISG